LLLGIKRPGREADHPTQSSVEVKNVWSYAFVPPYVFIAWDLIKKRILFMADTYFTTGIKLSVPFSFTILHTALMLYTDISRDKSVFAYTDIKTL
jgi:hypothetical protein